MAAIPKLTPEEWANVRQAWEADNRKGFPWLVDELKLPVSSEALRLRSKSEQWIKGGRKGFNSKLGINKKTKLGEACKVNESKASSNILSDKSNVAKVVSLGAPIKGGTLLKLTMKERAATFGEDAITVMSDIMNDVDVQPQVRLAACDKLLDRGFGKPKQEMEVSGELKYVDKADLEARYAKNMEKTIEYARIASERQKIINTVKVH